MTRTIKQPRPARQPSSKSDEDFNIDHDLPLRMKSKSRDDSIQIQLHSIPSEGAFLISCKPPKEHPDDTKHVPCDIVLVIDVSGSMNCMAPLPDTGDKSEDSGLSVLDLVKHASRTILETLDEGDRLGIVTFSDDAKVIQQLTPMDPAAKRDTQARIEKLHDGGITNLWSGIKTGLQLFEDATFTSNIQGLYVLTDGMPNHMCPKQGYVNKLKPMLANMAETRAQARVTMPTIHTFGFGYSIRSDLMQSIAEIGNGNYAFIPDAGMIGTVFVHAVANLFSTFAVNAVLVVESTDVLDLACSTALTSTRETGARPQQFQLGNIQYGQSRDLILRCNDSGSPWSPVDQANFKATLRYFDRFGKSLTTHATTASRRIDTPTPEMLAYHHFRSQLCAHLSSFFPIGENNEHAALTDEKVRGGRFATARAALDDLINTIRISPHATDPNIASLLKDLTANEGESYGQITKALQGTHTLPGQDNHIPGYWQKWGRHYLPSLLHAHARQVCNSFKDPGPLRYGMDSPLFIKCRDELDTAFDNLPAPKPSRQPHRGSHGRGGSVQNLAPVSMSRYHRSSNPCFAGSCLVRLADDSTVSVSNLLPGHHRVWTPAGSSLIVAVLRTDPCVDVQLRGDLCRIGNLWVTPWHPIKLSGKWTFPATVAEESKPCDEPVYSVLLEPADDTEAHAVEVGGVVAVTLGHGVITAAGTAEQASTVDAQARDVRAHSFFGDYQKVKEESLKGLGKDEKRHLRCNGVVRGEDGLVHGFLLVGARVLGVVREAPAVAEGMEEPVKLMKIPEIIIAAA